MISQDTIHSAEAVIMVLEWRKPLKQTIEMVARPEAWELKHDAKYQVLSRLDEYRDSVRLLSEMSEVSDKISSIVDYGNEFLKGIEDFAQDTKRPASERFIKSLYEDATIFFTEVGTVLAGTWNREKSHYKPKD